MNRRELLVTAGVTAATITTAGCSAGPGAGDGEGNDTAATDGAAVLDVDPTVDEDRTPDELAFPRLELYRTDEALGVVGAVENTADTAFAFVEVRAEVSREDEEIVGFTDDIDREAITDLGPGERWEFEIRFTTIEPEDWGGVTAVDVSADGRLAD